MRKWAEWLDKQSDGEADGSVPLLKPGDASMASPFTIKATDVMPTTDIIKQGRCTLVITMQMFKILGLLSLSSAYSLSVLYLAGVKLGDIQVRLPRLHALPRRLQAARAQATAACVGCRQRAKGYSVPASSSAWQTPSHGRFCRARGRTRPFSASTP